MRTARTIEEMRDAYAWQMAEGMCPRSLKCSEEVQLQRFCEARIYDRALVIQTKPILVERGIPAREHVQYYAFARALARLCRIYGAKVLANATLNLIDRWEFRGLDPQTLHAICYPVFAMEDRGDPPPPAEVV